MADNISDKKIGLLDADTMRSAPMRTMLQHWIMDQKNQKRLDDERLALKQKKVDEKIAARIKELEVSLSSHLLSSLTFSFNS